MKTATPDTRFYWGVTHEFLNHLTSQTMKHTLDVDGFKQTKGRVMQLSKSFLTGRYPAELTETFLKDRDRAFLEHVHSEGRVPCHHTYSNGQEDDMHVIAHAVVLDTAICSDAVQSHRLLTGFAKFLADKHPSRKDEFLTHFRHELQAKEMLALEPIAA